MQTRSLRWIAGAAFAGAVSLPQIAAQMPPVGGAAPVTTTPGSAPVTSVLPAQSIEAVAPAKYIVNDARWSDVPINPIASRGPHAAQLVNLSVRAPVSTSASPLIVGGSVGGDEALPLLVRAIGPGLAPFGVRDALPVVTLDYLGGGLQFVIMLPAENDSVDAVAARLTPEHSSRWASLAKTNPKYVALSLPKFTVAGATAPLAAALRALGMNTAFDVPAGSANFDAMAPRTAMDYLALSEVFHKTFVAVDEQGTEAAAATAVTGGVTSAPITPVPIEVRVDRPFLFAIQHRESATCLFLGRILDPR